MKSENCIKRERTASRALSAVPPWRPPLFRLRANVAAQRAGGVEHVRAHAAAGLVAIALSDGRQNAIVLLARARNAAALPQLRAPERPETNPDGNRLLRQERIVGGGVDCLVERA